MKHVCVQNLLLPSEKLTFQLGPCVIESEESALQSCEKILEQLEGLECQFIYKSSFDKANRSSIDSFRGPGIERGLEILQKVKDQFKVPIVSDIHLPEHANCAKDVLDLLQIPAFLCRQTDLILAAAQTKKAVSVKKGQFVAPEDMTNVVKKIESCGNTNIILTERGSMFGYRDLIVDMRSISVMGTLGYPVMFDASHAVQVPGGATTGGKRQFIPILAKSAIAAGAQAIYIECHLDPLHAKSDKQSVYPIDQLRPLATDLIALYQLIQNQRSYAQV
jgi:2-dehydro-3-deoxyphosphooctonate aldolase (KDO 8-P synthase)